MDCLDQFKDFQVRGGDSTLEACILKLLRRQPGVYGCIDSGLPRMGGLCQSSGSPLASKWPETLDSSGHRCASRRIPSTWPRSCRETRSGRERRRQQKQQQEQVTWPAAHNSNSSSRRGPQAGNNTTQGCCSQAGTANWEAAAGLLVWHVPVRMYLVFLYVICRC